MASPSETGGASNVTQLSDLNPAGTCLGQSTADLISFYNSTPIAQPASGDIAAQLTALGLFGSGQFTFSPVSPAPAAASSISSLSSVIISAQGITKVNSTVAKTYYVAPPIAGAEKSFYVDTPSTAITTIALNSTVPGVAGSSAVYLGLTGSQSTLTGSSASSLGNILLTNTTAVVGGMITLVGASTQEWLIKSVVTTLITYST